MPAIDRLAGGVPRGCRVRSTQNGTATAGYLSCDSRRVRSGSCAVFLKFPMTGWQSSPSPEKWASSLLQQSKGRAKPRRKKGANALVILKEAEFRQKVGRRTLQVRRITYLAIHIR